MTDSRALVIVPTYNEADNVGAILKAVHENLPDADFLLVDDSSPDGTANLAESLFGGAAFFHLLRRTGRRGLGLSYVDGYLWALDHGYDQIVQMDADFSHDPRYLPDLLRFAPGADVVLGSRYCAGGGVRNWPVRRQLLSRFANRYVSVITGIDVRDATSGFRRYSRQALERIGVETVESNGYAFQVEMTFRARRAGLAIAEMPIVFVDRALGASKMTGGIVLESVRMPWILRFGRDRSNSPQQAVSHEPPSARQRRRPDRG